METIQRKTLDDSPLAVLAQQGAEAANLVVAEKWAQDPSGKTVAPRTFGVKFPYDTQLTFRSLTFAAREEGDLKMLPPRSAPEHLALASLSASGGSYS
jgi:hypothetical protein